MPKKDNWVDDYVKIIEFCGMEWLVFDVRPELQSGGVDYATTVNNKHGLLPQEIQDVEFTLIIHNWSDTDVIDCRGTIFGPHGHGPEATVLLSNVKQLNVRTLSGRDEVQEYVLEARGLTAEMMLG